MKPFFLHSPLPISLCLDWGSNRKLKGPSLPLPSPLAHTSLYFLLFRHSGGKHSVNQVVVVSAFLCKRNAVRLVFQQAKVSWFKRRLLVYIDASYPFLNGVIRCPTWKTTIEYLTGGAYQSYDPALPSLASTFLPLSNLFAKVKPTSCYLLLIWKKILT